jgi:Argonaute PAZ domain
MISSLSLKKTSVVLNRFFVKQLAESDLTVREHICSFTQHPDQGQEQKAIARICYKLGVPAIRLGNKIITKESVSSARLQGDGWEVKFLGTRVFDCNNPAECKGIEQIERKILEQRLKQKWDKTAIEKASEGGLIWWITGEAGIEKFGTGWEVHRGRRIDVSVDTDSNLYLEIDLHHRFYTPWTLHEWQDEYPEVPISYVRNTYKDKNNKYITWKYEDISEQTPEQVGTGRLENEW